MKRLNERNPGSLDVAGIKIPSENCIAYQFCPKHPFRDACLQHTCALRIKHKVRARTLCAHHPDSYCVASFLKMMKRLGVVAAQVINQYTAEEEVPAPFVFYSMDGKAKISVDEPRLALSFSVRGRCIILPSDVKAIAGDHDFKVVSLTPSVSLRVEVQPNEGEDGTSCYRGIQTDMNIVHL